ncbi:DUF4136 domain-containing protein [Endozoicomonadaceae bacterium StTr2]
MTLFRLLSILLFTILSGCASQNVDWDYDPSHTLSNLKTYAWLDTDQSKLGYDSEGLTRQRIRTAVDRELTAKGFQRIQLDAGESPAGKVDFLINDRTEVKVRQQQEVTKLYGGYGYYPWITGFGVEATTRQYEQGTLIIDVIDPQTRTLIWTGNSWSRLSKRSTPEERIAKVNKAINLILSGFPVPQQ